MADNLFSDSETDSSAAVPFTGISDAPPVQDSPQGVSRTAVMAAIVNTPDNAKNLLASMDQNIQGYRDMIEKVGDTQIRTDAAIKQQVDHLNAVHSSFGDTNLMADPAAIQSSAAASQAVLAEDVQRRQEYALEQQSIEKIQNLAAAGNTTQARLLLDNIQYGGPDDVVRDMSVKRLILQREIEKAQISVQSQDWMSDALDFMSGWLPTKTSLGQIGNVQIQDGLKHWYDGLWSGQRVKAESDALWNMPAADYAKYVREQLIPAVRDNSTMLGLEGKTQELNILTKLQSPSPAWLENAQNSVDNLGMLPFTKVGKLAMSIPSIMIRTGARAEAENLITKAALDTATRGSAAVSESLGIDAAETADALLPKAVGGSTVNAVGISSDAGTRLQRAQALITEFTGDSALRSDRFKTNTEFETAVQATVDRITSQYGFDAVKDLDIKPVVNETRLTTGSYVRQIELTLGNPAKEGVGFGTEKQGLGYATSVGFGDAEIVRDESGQFFAKITRDMPETSFYTELLKTKASNVVSRLLMSGRAIGDEWLNNGLVQASSQKAKSITFFKGLVDKAYAPLTGEERGGLSQLLAHGISEAKWYDRGAANVLYKRAFGKEMSDNTWRAYEATVNLNDVSWAMRNDDAYMNLAIKGGKAISFDSELGGVSKTNGFEVENVNGRAFDIKEGIHYNKNNPMTPAQWESMKTLGYRAVNLETPVKLADGTVVKTVIGPADKIFVEPLDRFQLGYSEGLNRMYKGKWFAKQADFGVQPDDGTRFLKNPKTFIVGETQAEVKYWANRMEFARLAVKNGADEARLDEIFKGEAGFPTGKQFLEGLNDGTYSPEHEFESLYDREMPKEYSSTAYDKSFFNEDSAGYNDYLRTNGRMYYSAKGEHLPDFQGQKALTLDPYQTINKALMNVSSLSSFGDFKVTSIERWLNTYGKFLDQHSFDTAASSFTNFKNAIVSSSTNNRIRQAALAERQVITRNLGWKTQGDLEREQLARDISTWVVGDDPKGLRHDVGKSVINWWENSNPVQAIRGLASDAKLGFFNVGQLPLQVGTMVAAMSIEPGAGLRGMFMLPALRGYLTKAGTEGYLDVFAQRGLHSLGGFADAEEMKTFMRTAKQSGFFDINSIHSLVSDHGPDAALGNFQRGWNNTMQTGRFFFNEGEIWNRAVAFKIAWEDAVKKFPGVDMESATFNNHLLGRAEDFSFRMSNSSKAWWQSGALSIPTQFWAYNARMMEMMFGDALNAQQKIRLIMGQGLLYGSAGLPLVPFVSDYMKGKQGDAPNLDSFWGALDRGQLDFWMHKIQGDNIQYGKRFGTGSWFSDTVKDFFGASQYGQKTPADFFLGASGSIGGTFSKTAVDTFKTLHDLAGYSAAESGGGDVGWALTRDNLMRVASNISTLNDIHKAYMVSKYHTLVSSNNSVMATDLPSADAFGVALGFQPGEMDVLSARTMYNKDRSKTVDDAARTVVNYRQRWVDEPDNREQISKEINLFMKLQPRDLQVDILRKAQTTTSPSLYEKVERQTDKNKYKAALVSEMENTTDGSTQH